MVVTVQFKDKNKVFKGRTYDYLLHREEEIPKKGDIIRMLDSEYNYLSNGTRVKITNIREEKFEDKGLSIIRYIRTTLD